jgi:hypothetical protein
MAAFEVFLSTIAIVLQPNGFGSMSWRREYKMRQRPTIGMLFPRRFL